MTETNTDRHPKWQRVEPGTVIPGGQPYRVEYRQDAYLAAQEYRHRDAPWTVPENTGGWFVDSSWKPPLVLPTEPTWGIAVRPNSGMTLAKWALMDDQLIGNANRANYGSHRDDVLDFIPLTDEQVARIEQA